MTIQSGSDLLKSLIEIHRYHFNYLSLLQREAASTILGSIPQLIVVAIYAVSSKPYIVEYQCVDMSVACLLQYLHLQNVKVLSALTDLNHLVSQ